MDQHLAPLVERTDAARDGGNRSRIAADHSDVARNRVRRRPLGGPLTAHLVVALYPSLGRRLSHDERCDRRARSLDAQPLRRDLAEVDLGEAPSEIRATPQMHASLLCQGF